MVIEGISSNETISSASMRAVKMKMSAKMSIIGVKKKQNEIGANGEEIEGVAAQRHQCRLSAAAA
jgi:hypothetical protein